MSNCEQNGTEQQQQQSILNLMMDSLHLIALPSSRWKIQTNPPKSITVSESKDDLDNTTNKHIILSENNNYTLKIDMFMNNMPVQIPYISRTACNINDLITILNIFNSIKFCKCYLENHRENHCLLYTAPFIDVCNECIEKSSCTRIKGNFGNSSRIRVQENHVNDTARDCDNNLINITTKNDIIIDSNCIFCNKPFQQEEKLLRHYRNHLPSNTAGKFVCNICNQSFEYVSKIMRHFNMYHSDTKFIKCVICERKYRNVELIQKHVRNHTEHGPFSCKDCSEHFYSKYDLVKHHCKLFPYPKGHDCSVCNKKYATSNLLLQHQKEHLIHTSSKCKYCSKKFEKSEDLQVHKIKCKRMHCKHACIICKKEFATASKKLLHIKIVHSTK